MDLRIMLVVYEIIVFWIYVGFSQICIFMGSFWIFSELFIPHESEEVHGQYSFEAHLCCI